MDYALSLELTTKGQLWFIVLERNAEGLRRVHNIYEVHQHCAERGWRAMRRDYPTMLSTFVKGEWVDHKDTRAFRNYARANIKVLEG